MAHPPPSDWAQSLWPNLLIVTGFHPGDDREFTGTEIHKTVVSFLSDDEQQDFKNMTPNKVAVVALYFEVLMDYLPGIGSTTYQHFGYAKLHELDHPCLLGLYQGLIQIRECPLQEFLQAYEKGQLYSLIESKYLGVPKGKRGGYYWWFHERRELFDGLKPPESSQDGASSTVKGCKVCNQRTTTCCGRCRKVWYCSREHQNEDWKSHKRACKPSSSRSFVHTRMAHPPPSDLALSSWPNLRIVAGFHPGDDFELTCANVHKTVVHFLSHDEQQDFKNMTPNKVAVVALYFEVLMDYLPGIGSTTYQHFGYAKLHELDHPCLLGLYQGLIIILECPLQEFLQAYKKGQLYSLIESKYSGVPEGKRGGYYRWFHERRELFDGLKPPESCVKMGHHPR